jgi:ribA/ribD-fused uncharacterized protein
MFLVPKDWDAPFSHQNLQTMKFLRVPFGMADSPALLNMFLRYKLDEREDLKEVFTNIYVDNFVSTYDSIESAINQSTSLREYLHELSMNLREFQSNSDEILKPLSVDPTPAKVKVLGVPWWPKIDQIGREIEVTHSENITKREITGRIARNFDPEGLYSPVFIRAKKFTQELWLLNYDWDTKLPQHLVESWKELEKEWIGSHKIPRMIMPISAHRILHIFADSSSYAYGSVAYLQNSEDLRERGVILSKSRIAPTKMPKDLTIPRLELLAVLTAVRIAEFIKEQIQNIIATYIWSDSSIVLNQIQNQLDKDNVFIQNRLIEIRIALKFAEFRHVPTDSNPADYLSRGLSMSELSSKPSWWQGPAWLEKKENWPDSIIINKFTIEQKEMTLEYPSDEQVCLTTIETPNYEPIIGDDWQQSIKLTSEKLKTEGSNHDRDEAERVLIQLAQHEFEPSKKLRHHHGLYVHEDGLIHANNRLDNSSLDDAAKRPIFLPPRHKISLLIIDHYHRHLEHARYQNLYGNLSLKYWVAKEDVKLVIKQCLNCRLLDATPFSMPNYGQHPSARVTEGKPFMDTGTDLCGPFRLKGNEEVYLAIFTCLRVRAVHFEIVENLSAKAFSNAFYNFTSRRGTPTTMWSDNGTNFQAYEAVISPEINATQKFTWKFNTPSAPHQGGCWERLIQELKKALRSTIGRKRLPKPEFATTINKIEAALNVRPIIRLHDGAALIRPVDFILPYSQFGDADQPDVLADPDDPEFQPQLHNKIHKQLTDMHRRIKSNVNAAWQKWSDYYLPSFRDHQNVKPQKRKTTRLPRLGEIVLVQDDSRARYLWPTGVIHKIIKSPDGFIRRLELKMEGGRIWKRTVDKCYPLEFIADDATPPNESENNTPASGAEDNIHAFFSKDFAFSNFYPAPTIYKGLLLPTTEHHYVHQKATFHGDPKLINKALKATSPARAKRVMSNLDNFDVNGWEKVKFKVMKEIVRCKLHQHPTVLQELLETNGKIIAEASPHDKYWGTGLNIKETESRMNGKFPGRNELGNIYMELREEFKASPTESPSSAVNRKTTSSTRHQSNLPTIKSLPTRRAAEDSRRKLQEQLEFL